MPSRPRTEGASTGTHDSQYLQIALGIGPGSARSLSSGRALRGPVGAVRDDSGEQNPSKSYSIIKQPCCIARIVCRRRVRLRALAPQQMRGGGAPSGAPALCSRLDRSAGAQISFGVLRAHRRQVYAVCAHRMPSALAFRRSTAASIRLQAALLGGGNPVRQRAPRSQALVPGGRCPGAARVRRATLAPRPQAPHPAPSAERLRKTPLSEQGKRLYT